MTDLKPESTTVVPAESEAPSSTAAKAPEAKAETAAEPAAQKTTVEVDVADEILSPPSFTEVDSHEEEEAKGAAASSSAPAPAETPDAAAAAAAEEASGEESTSSSTTTTTTTSAPPSLADQALAMIQEDPTLQHKPVVKAGSSAAAANKPLTEEQLESERLYAQYLEEAVKQDFSDLETLQFLCTCGLDDDGRTVVVMIGSNLPAKDTDMDRVFLYLLKTLDPVVERDYVVVYVAANQNTSGLSFAWLKKVYRVFNRKYKKNLKKLYIVEAKSLFRVIVNFVMGLVSRKFAAKLVWVSPLNDIYRYLKPSSVHFPRDVVAALNTVPPLFGVSLDELARSNRNLREGVPIVVAQCLHHLYEVGLGTEGILRIPGDRTLVNQFKVQYDCGQGVYLNQAKDPFTVASLLKMYLHDLPEPLLTKEMHSKLLDTQMDPNSTEEDRIQAVTELLSHLPDINKAVLWNIMAFARAIEARSEENKMNIDNIALCLGPTLMWNQDVTDPTAIVREMVPINSLIKLMINHPEVVPDTPFKIDPPKPPTIYVIPPPPVDDDIPPPPTTAPPRAPSSDDIAPPASPTPELKVEQSNPEEEAPAAAAASETEVQKEKEEKKETEEKPAETPAGGEAPATEETTKESQ